MTVQAMSTRNRWVVAAIGAAVVMVLLAPLFLLPRITFTPPAMPPPPPVKLAEPGPANLLLREVTAMRDLAPLFLPTERNATLTRLPRRDVGRSLLDMDAAKLSLAEPEMRIERDFPPAVGLGGKVVTAAKPADALPTPWTSPAVLGLGRSTVEISPLAERGGYVEVVATRTGELVFGDRLDASVKPPTDKPWGPVQFLANVGAAGLVGPLLLTERSGAEEVDQHFRNYLAQTYRLGQRLPPGIYRITVGP